MGCATGEMAMTFTSFLPLTQVGSFYPSKASRYILPVPPQMLLSYFFCQRRGSVLRNHAHVKRHFSLFRSPAFYLLIFLLCGSDIERNPGPPTAEQTQEHGQSAILSKLLQFTRDVTDIKARLLS